MYHAKVDEVGHTAGWVSKRSARSTRTEINDGGDGLTTAGQTAMRWKTKKEEESNKGKKEYQEVK